MWESGKLHSESKWGRWRTIQHQAHQFVVAKTHAKCISGIGYHGKLVGIAMRQLYFEQVRIYCNANSNVEMFVSWLLSRTNSSEQLPVYVFVAFQLQTNNVDKEMNPVVFYTSNLSPISCWIKSTQFSNWEGHVSFAFFVEASGN